MRQYLWPLWFFVARTLYSLLSTCKQLVSCSHRTGLPCILGIKFYFLKVLWFRRPLRHSLESNQFFPCPKYTSGAHATGAAWALDFLAEMTTAWSVWWVAIQTFRRCFLFDRHKTSFTASSTIHSSFGGNWPFVKKHFTLSSEVL